MAVVIDQLSTVNWPPAAGEIIEFRTSSGVQSGILKEVRWGLLWRDFILEDGRVIPEQRVLDVPTSPVWREPTDVSKGEQQAWEEQLVMMAASGLDPHDREGAFWAALTQYLAYTYFASALGCDPEKIVMSERMTRSPDIDVSKWTSEAGLEEIGSLNLLPLIQNTRQRIFQWVQAMLKKGGSTRECQSAASAIGTLTVLGRRVHWQNPVSDGTRPEE